MKSDVGELEIDRWKNVSSLLNSLKGKVDKLDVNRLATALVDLRSSNAVDKKVAQKYMYDKLLKS